MLTFDNAVRMALTLASYKRARCNSVCFNFVSKEFTAYFDTETHASWVHFTNDKDTYMAAFKEYDEHLHLSPGEFDDDE